METLLTEMGESKRVRDHSWDYSKANTKEFTHGIHSYPAMMIPQVARRLIKEYGINAKVLLDPFVGSGSVLVEGILDQNIKKVYGVDINPLAIIIAEVKTTSLNNQALKNAYNQLISGIHNYGGAIKIPGLYNLEYWFKPSVSKKLALIKSEIEKIKNVQLRNFFLVAFSETVRNVSNTRKGEFKLYRISKEKLNSYNPDVIATFKKIVNKNIDAVSSLKQNKTEVNIKKADSRQKLNIKSGEVDLLVTSPPYGDSRTTVAYGQFSRLSSQWVGYDYHEIKNVDKNGLGGIPSKDLTDTLNSSELTNIIKKIKEADDKRARDVWAFYEDFFLCTKEINRVMKKGGKLCFVVGNRTVKGVNIPTDEIIVELFCNNYGYKHLKTLVRSIPNKKMPKLNSPTNKKGIKLPTMNHEYIVILEKKSL